MGATSVTGKGQGDSHGIHKPELHCGGCGCGFTEEEEECIVARPGCVTRIRQSNTATYISGGSRKIQVCYGDFC